MTNEAAMGYAILAAKRYLNADGDVLVQLVESMRMMMDEVSEDEAEEVYMNL